VSDDLMRHSFTPDDDFGLDPQEPTAGPPEARAVSREHAKVEDISALGCMLLVWLVVAVLVVLKLVF
jgi:hypothetical protein